MCLKTTLNAALYLLFTAQARPMMPTMPIARKANVKLQRWDKSWVTKPRTRHSLSIIWLKLIDDIKAASKAVVDSRIASTAKCGRLVNDFQKEWIVPAKMTSQAYRESMAHVLQGAEALILNTMCTTLNRLGVEISCLQHDGITCQQITPAQLQIVTNEVLKNTGYVIRLESENLNSF